MKFRTFYDANNNDILDNGECANDWVVYTVNVDGAAPTLINPLIDCSSLSLSNVNQCLSVAAAFDGASLVPAVAALYQDDLSSVTVTYNGATPGSGNSDCKWNFTYNYTIADDCGNSETCDVNYGGKDQTAPTGATTAGSTGTNACMSAAAGLFSFNAAAAAGGYTDNCLGAVTAIETGTEVVTGTDCGWTVTYTFKVVDVCGNELTGQTYTHKGKDQTPPVISGGTIGLCYPTAAAAEAAAIAATTATDNCLGVVTMTATTSGTCSATVTVTATDICGNSSSKTYNTRIDNTPPTITCPPNQTVSPTTLAGTVVNYSTPVVSDNCSGVGAPVRTAGLASGSTFPIGTTTVTWKVTDACGNTATCSFTVTVTNPYCDNEKKKVYVCHNGNTICVSINAVQAHLNHGDVLGPCPPSLRANPVVTEEVHIDNFKLTTAPNPLHSSTTIRYELPVDSRVNITLYDPMGKVVAVLVDASRNAGIYNYQLDASKLASGIYYYKMTALSGDQKFVQGQKLMIIK
jgi:hypothetical protein